MLPKIGQCCYIALAMYCVLEAGVSALAGWIRANH